MNKTTITRKEITLLCPVVTYDWLRRHEKEIGLDRCRVQFFRKPVLYRRSDVLLIFVNIGLLPADIRQNPPSLPNSAS